jgi:hypothetical protein
MVNRIAPPPVPVRKVTPPLPGKDMSPHDKHVDRWVRLASMIKAKAITVEELYPLSPLLVGPAIVGERLVKAIENGKEVWRPGHNIGEKTMPSNLSEAAEILSRAAKGRFLYFFNANKERVASLCDDSGKTLPGIQTFEYDHYNLPFFFALSRMMNGHDWTKLVEGIEKLNPALSRVLENIGAVIAGVEKALTLEEDRDLQRTPPPIVQSYMPSPAVPPQPLRRSSPPPIPAGYTGDPTVRQRPK